MITISKVKDRIKAGHDNYKIATWMVNTEIGKHIPFSLDDLPDSVTKASEIEAIVECLDEGNIQDAISIAEDAAIIILEDEGFEID